MDNDRRDPLTILLVEDDELVRWTSAESLADDGFLVIEAASADEALDILRARSDVDVLFTDVDMPGRLDGFDLALIARRLWPRLGILIASGRRAPASGLPENGRFLTKPYAPHQVARQIAALRAA